MGSRVLGAASACLVASGLFLCGLGGALALAEPSASPPVPGGTHSNGEDPGKGPKTDPDGSGAPGTKTDEDPNTGDNTETEKPGNGENPGNGNCGNTGSNGNAQHCGGSSPPSSPPTEPSPTPSTTGTSTSTSSTKTTTQTTSKTTETTTSTSTTEPGLPAPGGGGGGGGAVEVPSGRPDIPEMQLPPASEPAVIDSVPGIGAAAVDLPIPPITLPVIVAPAVPLGAGGGAGAGPALPAAPRGVSAEPPAGREPLPANVGSNIAVPASSYRIGYTDYLRSAGLSQVAALAVPGVAGMLVLTGAGGLVGYRQAKAGHAVHTSGTARFVN